MHVTDPQFAIPDVGHVIGGKYVVENVIGQGGMGIVYAAVNRATGKRVAIKMLLPHAAANADFARRFFREAQASARIDHRNVVDVYDAGDEAGSTYLVMEILSGQSLAEFLAERGKLELPLALTILEHVARGVEAAHAKGIIHRDLKPDNVFLRVDDTGAPLDPKVLDFGISKIDDPSLGLGSGTATGHAMGTPYYMAPEQMVAAKTVTPASDVYALGVILFEMLTGELPFRAENLPDLVLQLHTKEPRRLLDLLPDAPPELGAVISKVLARDPQDRYATVGQLIDALRPFGLGDGKTPLPSFRAPDRMSQIRRVDSSRFAVSPSGRQLVEQSGSRPVSTGSAVFGPTLMSSNTPAPGVASPAPPSSSAPKFVALAIVLVGLLGVAAVVLRMRSAPTPARPEPTVTAAPQPAPSASTGRAHVLAPALAGAELFVDGASHGILGANGETVITLDADRHFFELRRSGMPVASTMVAIAAGAMTDVALVPVSPVPAAAAPTATSGRREASSVRAGNASAPAAAAPSSVSPPPAATAMTGCSQRGANGACLDDL